ncbi:MAG: AAA ATPase, partial [Halothiobacillaceae bacterium]
LGANLEVDGKTVAHYIDILADLLLVRRLEPWHANVKKRLVKSPHFYVRDSGILHRLLGIGDYDALLSNPVLGKSWEGFVIENILSVVANRAEAYFYRTAAGAEIDLLLKFSAKELWAIEVKNSVAPKIRPGFHLACADIKASHKYIVYGGDGEFPIDQEITVLSLKNMLLKLGESG